MRRRLMMRRAGATPVLPAEYQLVQWISNINGGGQYIKIPVSTGSTAFDFDITFDTYDRSYYNDSGGSYIIGSNKSQWLTIGVSNVYGRFFIYSSTATGVYDVNFYQSENVNIKTGLNSTVSTTRYFNITVDGVTTVANQNLTDAVNISDISYVLLFKHDRFPFYCKMREFKMTVNGATEYHLYPCYRKADGIIGMYDVVNDVFFTNEGSNTFTKGADL